MKKIVIILTVACTVLFQSCKKPTEDSCLRDTASVAGSYFFGEIKPRASAGAIETDYTNIVLQPCERDDVIMLKADGTYLIKDEGNKCSPPADITGTWSISGSKFIMDGEEGDITYYNCFDKLEFVIKDVYVAGDQMKFLYVHQ